MNHHVIDLGFVQVCGMAGMDTVQQLHRKGAKDGVTEYGVEITLITLTRKGEPARMGSSLITGVARGKTR